MSGWKARIADDLACDGIRILWFRDDGQRLVTNGDMVQTLTEGAVVTGEGLHPLSLRDDLARSLLDALTRYYHGAEDTRALRKDYDHEKQRVDKALDALIALSQRGDYQ